MEFLKALEQIRTPFLNEIFALLTKLGEETIAVVIICVLFWCVNKAMAYKVGIVYFISALTVQGAKVTFRVDRPWVQDPTFSPVPSAIEKATGYSFPSGHTQGATALYGTLGIAVKNIWVKVACFSAVLAVAFSRMYLGVHTPADVITALVLTFITAILVCILYNNDKITFSRSLILSLIVFFGSVALLIYVFALYRNGIIEREYVSDCCKAAGAGIGCSLGFFIETNFINFSEKSKNIWMQILKVVIGIAGMVLIRSGVKEIFGESLTVDTIRYAIIILWVLAIWPLCIKKFFSVPKEDVIAQ